MKLKVIDRLLSKQHTLVVFLGDSITEQNYHLRGRLNYVGQLTERMMELSGRQSRVFNAGVSGDTTWGALGRLERDVLGLRPDLVFIMLGMNDAARGPEQVEQYKNNLREIIDRVRGIGGEAILLSQNILDFGMRADAIAARTAYPSYTAAMKAVALERDAPLCDMYAKWTEYLHGDMNSHLMLMHDSIHPNEEGHNLFAKWLAEFLQLPQ